MKIRLASLPLGVNWSQIHAAGWLGGIGLTCRVSSQRSHSGPTTSSCRQRSVSSPDLWARRHRIATDAKEIDSLTDRPEPVGRGRQPDCFSRRAREINSLLSCSFLKVSGRGGSCSRLVRSPGLGFRLAHTVVSSLDAIAIHTVDLDPNPARRCSLCSPSAQVSITLPQNAKRLSLGQCVDRTPHLVIGPMCPPSPPGSRPSIVTAGSLGYKLRKNATT